MQKNITISKLSKHLFWDVDRNTLNFDNNKAYIIKQVLEYGLMEDWKMIYQYYGISTIVQEVRLFRELDKKALSFISLVANTPLEKFRCYNYQQSIPQHWNF